MSKLIICSVIFIPLAIITNMYAAKLLPKINETSTFMEFICVLLSGFLFNIFGFANFLTVLTLI